MINYTEQVHIKSKTNTLVCDLYTLYKKSKSKYFTQCIDFKIEQENEIIENKLNTLNFSEEQLKFLSEHMINKINYNIDLSEFNSDTIRKYFSYLENYINNDNIKLTKYYIYSEYTNILEYYESLIFANYILDDSYYKHLLNYIVHNIQCIVNTYIINDKNINNTQIDVYISTLYYLINKDPFIKNNYTLNFELKYNDLYNNYLVNEYYLNTEEQIKTIFIENIIFSLNRTLGIGYWARKNTQIINLSIYDILLIIKLNLVFVENVNINNIYTIIYNKYNFIFNINTNNNNKQYKLLFNIVECINHINNTGDDILQLLLLDIYKTQYRKLNITEILSYEIDQLNIDNLEVNKLIINRLKILKNLLNNYNNNTNMY